MLGQDQLPRVRFPLGELHKDETRRMAASLGLRTAGKPDSQDICFVGRGGYRSFVRSRAPEADRPGPIVDTGGVVVGRHRGVADVTVGQRRGLGVAAGERRYVVAVDPATATVVVGRRTDLAVRRLEVGAPTWVDRPLPPGSEVEVQYRAHGEAAPAVLEAAPAGRLGVRFRRHQEAAAPGQTAVFYRGDEVLGGAIIEASG
jgi:tRNA-specific 2-thiouridylase